MNYSKFLFIRNMCLFDYVFSIVTRENLFLDFPFLGIEILKERDKIKKINHG